MEGVIEVEINFEVSFPEVPAYEELNGRSFTAKFKIGRPAWDDSESNLNDVKLYPYSTVEIVAKTSYLQ